MFEHHGLGDLLGMLLVSFERIALQSIEGALDTGALSPDNAEFLTQVIDTVLPRPSPFNQRVEALPMRGIVGQCFFDTSALIRVEAKCDSLEGRGVAFCNTPCLLSVVPKSVACRINEILGQPLLDDPGFEFQAAYVEYEVPA